MDTPNAESTGPNVRNGFTPTIPPLTNGDRLMREEYERRYDATPGLLKAELIDGVAYVPRPVGSIRYGSPRFHLASCLGQYKAATAGVEGGINSSIRLDASNMPQPDIVLIVQPSHGGQVRIDAEGYIEGGPELVVDVRISDDGPDLTAKLDVYRRYGVCEYVNWRVRDRAIDWFVLRGGAYERPAIEEGVYRSTTYPGLWLDVEGVIGGDWAAVARTLDQGLATPEHAAFVDRLAEAARGRRP